MRQLTIEDVNGLDAGEVVPSIKGTITRVFQRREGTNQNGEWSVQDALLAADGSEIKVKFWNHADLSDVAGKEVTLQAHQGKTGLTSLFAEDDDYKGKITRYIRATAATKILAPEEPDELPMDHDDKGQALSGVTEARQHIMRAVNLYNLCVDAVDAAIKPHINNCTAELYQAAIGTLFIEASRGGYVSKMPDKPIKKA